MTLSIIMFCQYAEYHDADCCTLFIIMLNAIMLSVIMLSVDKQNLFMLSVEKKNLVMLSVDKQNLVMLSVVMLSFVAPPFQSTAK